MGDFVVLPHLDRCIEKDFTIPPAEKHDKPAMGTFLRRARQQARSNQVSPPLCLLAEALMATPDDTYRFRGANHKWPEKTRFQGPKCRQDRVGCKVQPMHRQNIRKKIR